MFKAYIIPKVMKENEFETQIMKSRIGAHIAAGSSFSDRGYEIVSNEHLNTISKFFKRIPSYDKESFYKKVEELVEISNLTENKIEKFCNKNGLIPTRLIFK